MNHHFGQHISVKTTSGAFEWKDSFLLFSPRDKAIITCPSLDKAECPKDCRKAILKTPHAAALNLEMHLHVRQPSL